MTISPVNCKRRFWESLWITRVGIQNQVPRGTWGHQNTPKTKNVKSNANMSIYPTVERLGHQRSLGWNWRRGLWVRKHTQRARSWRSLDARAERLLLHKNRKKAIDLRRRRFGTYVFKVLWSRVYQWFNNIINITCLCWRHHESQSALSPSPFVSSCQLSYNDETS